MRHPLLFPFAHSPLLALIATMLLFSCSKGPAPDVAEGTFAPCPDSPNCVSSDSKDTHHAIAPFLLNPQGKDSWPEIQAAVLSLPRTKVVSERTNYVRVECRSAVLRFVDDLELQLRPEEGIVAVRSASRTGYYDFGVNRRRIEKLRSILQDRGLLTQRDSTRQRDYEASHK